MSQGYAFVQKGQNLSEATMPIAAVPVVAPRVGMRSAPHTPANLADHPASSVRALLQPLMNRLSAPAALIAADGVIVVTNEAWSRFADREGDSRLGLGGNYMDFVHRQGFQGSPHHTAIATLLDDVAAGRQSRGHHPFKGDGPLARRASGINLTSLPFRDHRYVLVHRYE